jgi:hypothetical protein
MNQQQEVIVIMDMSNEAVRIWFEKIKSQAGHPQYQEGIRIVGPFPMGKKTG